MSSFSRYRTRMNNSENCRLKYESNFLLDGAAAVEIYVPRLQANKQAALIITEKEGPDTTLVYTFLERVPQMELLKADYFTWKNNAYFVYQNIEIVNEAIYKKQQAYQCNVDFVVDGETYYGYYVASLAKYVDTSLQDDLNITDNDKPILIMPTFDWLKVGQKIVIKNKPYKIIDFDIITNDQIAYISLDRDFISKQEDVIEEDIEEPTEPVLRAGIEISLPIQYGYFKTSVEVELITKTATVVNFIIPYGIEEIEITTKDENKVDVKKVYKVVI